MGIELYRVPKDWKHPTEPDYKARDHRWTLAYQPPHNEKWRPLYMSESWDAVMRSWWWDRITHGVKRAAGYWPSVLGLIDPPFAVRWPRDENDRKPPSHYDYRPRWRAKDRTHLQLYETVSEGTPISPVCATIDELADWCAKERNVWVGTENMDRAAWLRFFARGGWAPSGIVSPGRGWESGVEYMTR